MIRQLITNTRQGDITFHADGRIDITAHVAGTLHLQRGDVLNIATTDDTPAEHAIEYSIKAAEQLAAEKTYKKYQEQGIIPTHTEESAALGTH